jgi:hypothetical protein
VGLLFYGLLPAENHLPTRKVLICTMPAVLLARADIPSSAFMPLSLNAHRNSQQNAKKNFLERKCVAAKVAKFRLLVFCVASAFRFFLLLFFVPKIGGLPPQTFSPFFPIWFLACVLFFLCCADAKFPFCFSLFFLFFVPFFFLLRCWMRLRDMIDSHLYFCSTVKKQVSLPPHTFLSEIFFLIIYPFCVGFCLVLLRRISVCVEAQGHEST